MARQATRRWHERRVARLASQCGFGGFSEPVGDEIIELPQLLNGIPDEELGEVEAALKDFQGLQEALRSQN